MLTEKQIQIIKSENEYLLVKIEEINETIAKREKEQESLRQTAKKEEE